MEGSDLTFESKISGTPIPKITWFKDEREIIPGNFMPLYQCQFVFMLYIIADLFSANL